ncbi:MAG: hypothetical protein ACRD0K_06710 [Egibacteraceae bacterium]
MFWTGHAQALLASIGQAAGIDTRDHATLEEVARRVGFYYAQVRRADGLWMLPRTIRDDVGADDVHLEEFLRVPPYLLQRHAEGGVLVAREDDNRPYDVEYVVD